MFFNYNKSMKKNNIYNIINVTNARKLQKFKSGVAFHLTEKLV